MPGLKSRLDQDHIKNNKETLQLIRSQDTQRPIKKMKKRKKKRKRNPTQQQINKQKTSTTTTTKQIKYTNQQQNNKLQSLGHRNLKTHTSIHF